MLTHDSGNFLIQNGGEEHHANDEEDDDDNVNPRNPGVQIQEIDDEEEKHQGENMVHNQQVEANDHQPPKELNEEGLGNMYS